MSLIFVVIAFLCYLLGKAIYKSGFVIRGKDGTWFRFVAARQRRVHGTCDDPAFRNSVILLMGKVASLSADRLKYEVICPPREQMNYAEQRADAIVSILLKIYIKALYDAGVKSPVSSYSFLIYRLLLSDMKREILDKVRDIVQDNHFADGSDSEYRIYTNDRVQDIINMATDILNTTYFYTDDISREEVFSVNMSSLGEIRVVMTEVFDRFRRVSQDTLRSLKSIDERQEGLFQDFLKSSIE